MIKSKITLSILAVTLFMPLYSVSADETITNPVLPISEEVEKQNIVNGDDSSESSGGLLENDLNNATDRSITDNQGLKVSTGIDRAAIIAGVIATIIGFIIFGLIGVLRKINFDKDTTKDKED